MTRNIEIESAALFLFFACTKKLTKKRSPVFIMDVTLILQLVPALVSFACAIFMLWLNRRIEKRDKIFEREEEIRIREEESRRAENEAIREGMQAILRDRIIQMYAHCESEKHVPIYAMENMTHMYNAYHTLGGNGAISAIFEKFKKLPHSHPTDGN